MPYYYTLQITSLGGMVVTGISDTTIGLHVGKNTIQWDGCGYDGKSLPNGIYLYRLAISGGNLEREYRGKIVLLR